jgi:aldehyde dehydrogenase (NAD+)
MEGGASVAAQNGALMPADARTKGVDMNVMTNPTMAPKAPESFFISAKWREPISNQRLKVISPVTEEELLSYPEAGPADIDRAVAAARDAFDNGPWPRMEPAERAKYLRKVAEFLSERLDDIAQSWTLQVGAPISLTKKLVGQNPTLFNYYADLIETYPLVDEV